MHDDPGPAAWADLDALLRDTEVRGQTTEWFCKRWRPLVERHGWSAWIDPGNKFAFRRRSQGVLRCIFVEAHTAKRNRQLRDSKCQFWIYRAESDPRFCPPEHHQLDRVVLPVNHPFWERWMPPNCFGCFCSLTGVHRESGIPRLGGDPDKPLPDWWADPARGPDPAFVGDKRPDLRAIVAVALADRLPT